MLLRPARADVAIVGLFTGRVLIGVGGAMLVPALLGFAWGEVNAAAGLAIGAFLALIVGAAAEAMLPRDVEANWTHGMLTSAVSWLAAAFFGALPLYLSGHYDSFLDAYFDAMSGFATAGLAVINDLDHLADSVNLWRHLMHFLGGQGLVLLVLSLFPSGEGAVGMYAGEAREDRIVPNVARTARFIWRVSLLYFLIGVTALYGALLAAGLTWSRALFHAVVLFFAAFDTGGFAPTSASIGLYHSATLEAVISVLMVAGGLSFALHYHLWQGRGAELGRSDEVRLFALSNLTLFAVAAIGLASTGTYENAAALVRRGFFHILSAHTGTGFNSIPGRLLLTDWAVLAPMVVVIAMGLGAMAGSTAGGIKMIRVVLVLQVLRRELRRLFLPRAAQLVETFHSAGRRQVLRDEVVRAALLILLLYLGLYLAGALVGMFYGYPFEQAMFESTSAAAAVGLSIGITGPRMEQGLEIVYILQMWIGRLEFVAVLALLGFAWSALRGRT